MIKETNIDSSVHPSIARCVGALVVLFVSTWSGALAQDSSSVSVQESQSTSAAGTFSPVLAAIPDPGVRQSLSANMRLGPRLRPSAVRDVMQHWRESDGGPANGPSWLLVARLWRQAGVPDSAHESLRHADDMGGLPNGLLSLEAARLAFMSGNSHAAGAYWEGCDQAGPAVLGEYWIDFVAVATSAEATEWSAAESIAASRRSAIACAILRRAWAERAVQTGMSVDQRLAVHYSRLRHARQYYYLVGSGSEERLGPRTRLLSFRVGRPRDAGLDDRGLLYLRLGEPDATASFSGLQNASRRKLRVDLGISPTCYNPNVTWAYEFPDGLELYHLSPLEGAANWWLIENLYDLYRCGDPSDAVSSGAAATLNPAVASRSAPIGQIAWLVLPDLYLSRAGLDAHYATLSHRIVSSGPSGREELQGLRSLNGGALALHKEFLDEQRISMDAAEAVLAHVLERPDVRRELRLMFTMLQFRDAQTPGGERTRVWLNAVVGAEQLETRTDPEGNIVYEVEATFSALGEGNKLSRRTASFKISAAQELGADAGVPVRLSLQLSPGEHTYSVVIRDANDRRSRQAGIWAQDTFIVRRYDARLPQLSDIAFAPDSGGTWSPTPGVALPVSPVNITDESGLAWIYFEAYGLSPQGEYVTEIQLQPRKGGEPFALRYVGSSPRVAGTAIRRLLRVDLSDTEPGEYDARIVVTDALGRRSLPVEVPVVVR